MWCENCREHGHQWPDCGRKGLSEDFQLVDELDRLLGKECCNLSEHEVDAATLSGLICNLLTETILKDDREDEKLGEWADKVHELRCKLITGHLWVPDMCNYWGHKYCAYCNLPKYPELNQLSCKEAKSITNDCPEEDWEKAR